MRDQTGRACGALEGLRDCPGQKATRETQLLDRRERREGAASQVAMEVSEIRNSFIFASCLPQLFGKKKWRLKDVNSVAALVRQRSL